MKIINPITVLQDKEKFEEVCNNFPSKENYYHALCIHLIGKSQYLHISYIFIDKII